MFDKKDKSEANKIIETVGVSTIVIAALIVIFARNYSWVIIFTTTIICLFGIIAFKINSCAVIEKPVVKKPTVKKTKKK